MSQMLRFFAFDIPRAGKHRAARLEFALAPSHSHYSCQSTKEAILLSCRLPVGVPQPPIPKNLVKLEAEAGRYMQLWWKICVLVAFLFSRLTWGIGPDLCVEPIPVFISGTLSPLDISVAGQRILSKSVQAISLSVNGKMIIPTHRSDRLFFLKSDSDNLIFSFQLRKGSAQKKSFSLTLPVVTGSLFVSEKIVLFFNKKTRKVSLDGGLLLLERASAIVTTVVPAPKEVDWYQRSHVLMLKGRDGTPVRFYRLTFPTGQPPASQTKPSLGVAHRNLKALKRVVAFTENSPIHVTSFDVMGLAIFPRAGENVLAPALAWTPGWYSSEVFHFYASVAASATATNPKKVFLAAEFQLFMSIQKQDWSFDAGGGLQMWLKSEITRPLTTLMVRRYYGSFSNAIRPCIFLGVSGYFIPNNYTHQVRLGMGFSL